LDKNTDAQQFYSKHGFVKTGERKPEEGTSEYMNAFIEKSAVRGG
jgi:putative acetyltransferase